MSDQRDRKRSAKTLVVDDAHLDDPLWEKLAAGEATHQEIGVLIEWAARSPRAAKALELFLPPTSDQVERLINEVLSQLDKRIPSESRERLNRLLQANGRLPLSKTTMAREHELKQGVPRIRCEGPFRAVNSVTTSALGAVAAPILVVQEPDESTASPAAQEYHVARPKRRREKWVFPLIGGLAACLSVIIMVVASTFRVQSPLRTSTSNMPPAAVSYVGAAPPIATSEALLEVEPPHVSAQIPAQIASISIPKVAQLPQAAKAPGFGAVSSSLSSARPLPSASAAPEPSFISAKKKALRVPTTFDLWQ